MSDLAQAVALLSFVVHVLFPITLVAMVAVGLFSLTRRWRDGL